MMLKRIINRIKEHEISLAKYKSGEICDIDFEDALLDEIEFLQDDFEKKLSLELLEEEEKFHLIFSKIKTLAVKKNIDKTTLKNLILSEINQIVIEKNML